MLVYAHRAQRVDRQTHLLAKTNQQPVDLTPQLPRQGGKRSHFTVELVQNLHSPHFGAVILWRHKRVCFFLKLIWTSYKIKSTVEQPTWAATPPRLCAFPPGSWQVFGASPGDRRCDAHVCQPLQEERTDVCVQYQE